MVTKMLKADRQPWLKSREVTCGPCMRVATRIIEEHEKPELIW